jgi:tetratricopeptide (TPR) repeat protein
MATTLRPHLAPAALLAVITWLVYGRCLGHEFLLNWDDPLYVTRNPAILGLTPANLKTAFSTFFVGNYAPLQIVSYMVDYTVWGLEPAGFIATNILLHMVNGLLFYLLVHRLAGDRLAAFIAAIVFLCHPVQVESVAWVSQRKNVLAMLFFLAALLSYLRWREPDARPVCYGSALLFFLCALLTKSVTVVLPAVLLVHELAFAPEGSRGGRWRRLAPFVLVAGLAVVLAFVSQSPDQGGGRVPYHGGSIWATALTMLTVFVRYLQLLVWPVGLSAFYDVPVRTGPDLAVAGGALLLLVSGAGTVWLWRHRRDLAFWVLVAVIGLLPVTQVIPLVTLMNDRYLYFPLLGAGGLLGCVVAELVRRGGDRRRPVTLAVIALLLLPLPLLASHRTDVWRNSLALWTDAEHHSPRSTFVLFNLGESYYYAGQYERSLATFARERELDPAAYGLDYFQGLILAGKKDYPAAVAAFERAMLCDPTAAAIQYNLALALEGAGRTDEAAARYNRLLLLPAGEYHARGRQRLAELGPLVAASLAPLRERVAASPGDLAARSQLALRLDTLGFFDEALAVYQGLAPAMGDSWQLAYNTANVYQTLRRFSEAARSYERSLALKPDNPDAWNNLGLVYTELEDFRRAATAFQKALTLDDRHAFASFNLAKAYLRLHDRAAALRQFRATAERFPALKARVAPFLKNLDNTAG